MTRFWNNLHQERSKVWRDRWGRDHMVVGFTTTYEDLLYESLATLWREQVNFKIT
jgi:hypothetical protein